MEKTTLIKFGKIAIAIALSFIICGVSLRPALADDDHNRGQSERGDKHDKHHKKKGHDRGKHRGWTKHYTPQPTRYYGPAPTRSYAPAPNYYYAPPPNYYYAPEPDRYYYNTQPQYQQPSALSEGINLFFGLH
jgi:hypothetical protein